MSNIGNNDERTVKMGMSASQARFLSLTARKTNVEYEGQQINQQRTALSNESSNYYSQLTSMTVPTPPSTSDYTKISYKFANGNESNTVTSLVAKQDGLFMLNYVQEIPQDAMLVQGTVVISKVKKDSENKYLIGSDELQEANRTSIDKIVITDKEPEEKEEGKVYYTRTQILSRFISSGMAAEVANGMSNDEIRNKLAVEAKYSALAEEKYDDSRWYVRYQKNSATGVYEPLLFSAQEVENAEYNEKTTMSLSGIHSYVFGQGTETKEVKNAIARVEQDSSGRYISIIVYPTQSDADENKNGSYYKLTTTTESDEAAYNDAMNQYYYNKAKYDQQIQEVNSKIEIIQVQDKNLELKLKQLDTEENAISTEMDAVKKVISKNVESSFKTFSA